MEKKMISLVVEPNYFSVNAINGIGQIFEYGNEEFGPPKSMFNCLNDCENIDNLDEYKEYYLDMLSFFNLIRAIRTDEIFEFKPIEFVELNPNTEGYRIISKVENTIFTNYLKKSYFSLIDLPAYHSYLPREFQSEGVTGVIKSEFFVNNLLRAASIYDVFHLVFLWSESQRNKMYFFINMYKIYEIIDKTGFEETTDEYKIGLESAIKESLKKSKKYLGNFSNNTTLSGVFSRHGNNNQVDGIDASIEEMIEYTNENLLVSIRLYFARISIQ